MIKSFATVLSSFLFSLGLVTAILAHEEIRHPAERWIVPGIILALFVIAAAIIDWLGQLIQQFRDRRFEPSPGEFILHAEFPPEETFPENPPFPSRTP
ncbi:MAG: hypothetical protein HQL57_02725 [Magnetococcales bacterium]|nr:hypothetical protein [Magnetococcales bacterium]MBF0156082.1 hypothetical protein [Magnetococcales bacterium]